jgi:predicted  nucleic acid-binding Zn-ribbon protein
MASQVDSTQRSLIDYEIQIQTLSKQMLAASLKAQSEYRDLEDRYKELSDDLYDKENKLQKAQQQLKEFNIKALKDREKITETLESVIIT